MTANGDGRVARTNGDGGLVTCPPRYDITLDFLGFLRITSSTKLISDMSKSDNELCP